MNSLDQPQKICFSPIQPDFFLVSYLTKSISLFNISKGKNIYTWTLPSNCIDFTWSKSSACIFYVLLEDGLYFVDFVFSTKLSLLYQILNAQSIYISSKFDRESSIILSTKINTFLINHSCDEVIDEDNSFESFVSKF
jgi:hypothetical protein